MPPHLTRMVESFLRKRLVYGTADGHASRTFELVCGVPQGSPLSPILFLIFINPLLVRLNKIKGNTAQGYADDSVSFTVNAKPEQYVVVLNKSAQVTSDWSKDYSMDINPDKTELIHFQRMRKGPVSNTCSIGLDIIKPSTSIRYLGVQLDIGLKFREHVDIVTTKASAQLFKYNSACKKTYGASLHTTRLYYRCAVFAITTYAFFCRSTLSDTIAAKIGAVQRMASLRSTGCVKTTSQAALDKGMNVLPISLALKKAAAQRGHPGTRSQRTKSRRAPHTYAQKHATCSPDPTTGVHSRTPSAAMVD